MLELGEFDLQLAFVSARALREDIENQAAAIDHAALEPLFEVALLRRRQVVIEQNQGGARVFHGGGNLFNFARSGESGRIGTLPAAFDKTQAALRPRFRPAGGFLPGIPRNRDRRNRD